VRFTNPSCTVGSAAMAKLNVMFRCVNNVAMTIKPGHQETGNM
jgi:hypothetical protein